MLLSGSFADFLNSYKNRFFIIQKVQAMPAKQTISILALSILMALPTGIASAGNIIVENGNSRVTIYRNGDIKIRNSRRERRLYRRRLRRGSKIRPIRSYGIYRQTTRKRGNCTTYRSTRKSGYGRNRSVIRTTTKTCQ